MRYSTNKTNARKYICVYTNLFTKSRKCRVSNRKLRHKPFSQQTTRDRLIKWYKKYTSDITSDMPKTTCTQWKINSMLKRWVSFTAFTSKDFVHNETFHADVSVN